MFMLERFQLMENILKIWVFHGFEMNETATMFF